MAINRGDKPLQVHDISAADVKVLLDKQEPLLFVDVRTQEEQQVRSMARRLLDSNPDALDCVP